MEQTDVKAKPPFGFKDKIGYAMGDFGCNLSFSLISAFMIDFYTQYIKIADVAWMVIIILTKVWDGINDPIMGSIVDRVRIGKSGSKFKPWIRIGAIGLIFTGALVFLPIPDAAGWVKITVCIVTYLLWDVCYTLLNVPYGALNSAISADPIERTQLSTWRSIGAAVGGAICVVLPLFVYDENNSIIGGRLIWMGLIMGLVAFVAYTLLLKLTTERVHVDAPQKQKINYIETVKAFFKNRPLIAMCIASFALLVFFMSCTTTTKWLFQVYFGNAGTMVTVATVVAYLPMVFFIPFTSKIVKKLGKKKATALPLISSIVAAFVMLFVPVSPDSKGGIIYMIGLMCIQTGGGLFQLICWAMITDCIDYQQLETGKREEGSVYAFYSFFRKVSQGVALVLPLACMSAVGYNSKAEPISNQLPGVGERMVKMSVILMLVGAVMMFLALMFVYNLGKSEVARISRELGKEDAAFDLNNAIENRNE